MGRLNDGAATHFCLTHLIGLAVISKIAPPFNLVTKWIKFAERWPRELWNAQQDDAEPIRGGSQQSEPCIITL